MIRRILRDLALTLERIEDIIFATCETGHHRGVRLVMVCLVIPKGV